MKRNRRDKSLEVVTVGRLPPPVGGVNSSIQSLLRASNGQRDISLKLIDWTQMWKLPFWRPDVLHLHFSTPSKRVLGSLIGLLSQAHVVHTVHSNNYDFKKFGNWLAAYISSGFILLNNDIMNRFRTRGVAKVALMTPIMADTISQRSLQLDIELEKWFERQEGNVAVVYCYDRREYNGDDIYGFSFVAGLLPILEKRNWSVLFLDPNGHYASGELFTEGTPNALLRSSHVEFAAILPHTSAYLRPTATDGNSVAVLEALNAGVSVIASDVVPRPRGVHLYRFRDQESFLEALSKVSDPTADPVALRLTTFDEYAEFLVSLQDNRN